MKILIDLTSIYDKLSGIEKFCLNISKNMIFNDTSNEYLLLFKKEIHEEFKFIHDRQNIDYKILNVNNKILLDQIVVPFQLYKYKCDAYLFLAFPSPALFFSKKTVNAVHDMTPWLFPETMSFKGLVYFKFLIKLALLRSKLILTVSNNSKKDILRFYNHNNIQIINNGVDKRYRETDNSEINDVRIKYNLPQKYLLCIGTLEPRKNTKLLIDAFVNLKIKKNIPHKLVITGRHGWKYDSILSEIKEKNLEKEIIFTGFVDEADLPCIYKGADLFVFPSLYEGFGIPPLEAMASGVPVIVSDSSSLPEVVGEKGIMFENNNQFDLENKIIDYINLEESKKKEYIQYCLERSKMFKWENESKKLLNVLEKNFKR